MKSSTFEPLNKDFLDSVFVGLELSGPESAGMWRDMLTHDEERIAQTDPVVLNLEVAKGIPELAGLEVLPYRQQLDQAAADFSRWLPHAEQEFQADPAGWGNDLVSFRLGMLCQFIEQVLGVRYNEDQRNVQKFSYTNPGDLFLTDLCAGKDLFQASHRLVFQSEFTLPRGLFPRNPQ